MQVTGRAIDPIVQFGEADSVEEESRLRMLNAQRQKSLVSDAARLLRLAAELNAEVIKQEGKETLTPNDLRKCGEIEKLARNVREKMIYSVRFGPVFHDPPPFPASVR